ELADVVISTGGIGPTADDLTNETVARVLGVPLALDRDSADRIRQLFAALGRDMPENNLKQALLPQDAVVVPNPMGTAPGYRIEARGRHLVVLPGVPREMKVMMEETVLPWLRTLRGGDVYLSRIFQTFGLTESALDEMVAGAVDPSEARVSFRASFPEISLRIVVHGAPETAAARLETLAARVRHGPRTRHHRDRGPRRRDHRETCRDAVGRGRHRQRHDGAPLPALGHARLDEAPRLPDRARLAPSPCARAAARGLAALPAAIPLTARALLRRDRAPGRRPSRPRTLAGVAPAAGAARRSPLGRRGRAARH